MVRHCKGNGEPLLFHYLDKYARDDTVVKLIFDHLRNFGLATVVLAAGGWKQRHVGVGVAAIWDHAVAAILAFVGFGLVWLNHEHLFHKVRDTNHAKWLKVVFALIYTVTIMELYKYVQAGKGGT